MVKGSARLLCMPLAVAEGLSAALPRKNSFAVFYTIIEQENVLVLCVGYVLQHKIIIIINTSLCKTGRL